MQFIPVKVKPKSSKSRYYLSLAELKAYLEKFKRVQLKSIRLSAYKFDLESPDEHKANIIKICFGKQRNLRFDEFGFLDENILNASINDFDHKNLLKIVTMVESIKTVSFKGVSFYNYNRDLTEEDTANLRLLFKFLQLKKVKTLSLTAARLHEKHVKVLAKMVRDTDSIRRLKFNCFVCVPSVRSGLLFDFEHDLMTTVKDSIAPDKKLVQKFCNILIKNTSLEEVLPLGHYDATNILYNKFDNNKAPSISLLLLFFGVATSVLLLLSIFFQDFSLAESANFALMKVTISFILLILMPLVNNNDGVNFYYGELYTKLAQNKYNRINNKVTLQDRAAAAILKGKIALPETNKIKRPMLESYKRANKLLLSQEELDGCKKYESSIVTKLRARLH